MILTYIFFGGNQFFTIKNSPGMDFPGSPVVESPPSTAGGLGSIPGRGTKIPHAVWCGQKQKTKNKNQSWDDYPWSRIFIKP